GGKDLTGLLVVVYFFDIFCCPIGSGSCVVPRVLCQISGLCQCGFPFGFCPPGIFFTPEDDLFLLLLLFLLFACVIVYQGLSPGLCPERCPLPVLFPVRLLPAWHLFHSRRRPVSRPPAFSSFCR